MRIRLPFGFELHLRTERADEVSNTWRKFAQGAFPPGSPHHAIPDAVADALRRGVAPPSTFVDPTTGVRTWFDRRTGVVGRTHVKKSERAST